CVRARSLSPPLFPYAPLFRSAFRYRSRLVGFLVTLISLVASLPYLAQQIRAVVDSLGVMTGPRAPAVVGLGFCAVLALFAILFRSEEHTSELQSRGHFVCRLP